MTVNRQLSVEEMGIVGVDSPYLAHLRNTNQAICSPTSYTLYWAFSGLSNELTDVDTHDV